MGVSRDEDLDDFDLEGSDDEFDAIEASLEKRHARKPGKTRTRTAAWQSVEDYLENKRLRSQLSDVFDDDWQ